MIPVVYTIRGTKRGPQALRDSDLDKLPQSFGVIDWGGSLDPNIRELNDQAVKRLRDSGRDIKRFAYHRLDLIPKSGIESMGGNKSDLFTILENPNPPIISDVNLFYLNFPDRGVPYEVKLRGNAVRSTGYQKVRMSSPIWQELVTDSLAGLSGYDGIWFEPPKATHTGILHYPTFMGGSRRRGRILWQHAEETAVEWWQAVESMFWSLRRKTDLPICFDLAAKVFPLRYSKRVTEQNDAIHTQTSLYDHLDGMNHACQGLAIRPLKGAIEQREDDLGKFDVPDWWQKRNIETIKRLEV